MIRNAVSIALGALALACASTSTPNHRTVGFQVKNDTKEVSPGHWVGPWERRGVCSRMVGTKEEEAGIFTQTGTFDGVWTSKTTMSSCSSKGVATCTFSDGSSFTDESNLTCHLGPDGKLVFEGHGVFVKGTGRFEGIQGTSNIVSSQHMTPPPEDMSYDVVDLKYTLPKK